MRTSVDRAIANGTAFKIKSEDCQSLDGQISNSKNYDRLVQVVTLEGSHGPDSSPANDNVLSEERTFFMIGKDAELNSSSAGFNNEIYIESWWKNRNFYTASK